MKVEENVKYNYKNSNDGAKGGGGGGLVTSEMCFIEKMFFHSEKDGNIEAYLFDRKTSLLYLKYFCIRICVVDWLYISFWGLVQNLSLEQEKTLPKKLIDPVWKEREWKISGHTYRRFKSKTCQVPKQ